MKSIGGYIYLISEETDKYLKIGIATNSNKRLCSIQTGNPYTVKLLYSVYVVNMRSAEKAFHTKFKSLNYKGEWFLKDDNIIQAFEKFSIDIHEIPVFKPGVANVGCPKLAKYNEALAREYII